MKWNDNRIENLIIIDDREKKNKRFNNTRQKKSF